MISKRIENYKVAAVQASPESTARSTLRSSCSMTGASFNRRAAIQKPTHVERTVFGEGGVTAILQETCLMGGSRSARDSAWVQEQRIRVSFAMTRRT